MNILTLDVENSVTHRDDGTIDMSPYNANNFLVSSGFKRNNEAVDYLFFQHNDMSSVIWEDLPNRFDRARDHIAWADMLVGHNIKHDLQWLLATGILTLEDLDTKQIYDTMIGEYVLMRGVIGELSLAACTENRGLTKKRVDLTKEYLDAGVGFEAIPIKIVAEYGIADINGCYELYVDQHLRYQLDKNKGLVKTLNLMNEFCIVASVIEYNGINIDVDRLNEVEQQYKAEQEELRTWLARKAHDLMGDTPINLGSGDDLSMFLYSRKVKDKKAWKETFNIGTDDRGKKLRRPRLKPEDYRKRVLSMTDVVYKTKAYHCTECKGSGKYYRTKKDGTKFAKPNNCKMCGGTGIVYVSTGAVAGLKLKHPGIPDVAQAGWATNKEKLEYYENLIRGKNPEGAEFLQKLRRLSQIDSYLSSFVNGIRRGIQVDGILHFHLNQCVTSTGRLSSSGPNFQNMPRSNTFPIRDVITSRWEGGNILDADQGQLEFRAAGFLSQCKQVLQDLLDGVDVHANTRDALIAAGEPTDRTGAKSRTFKPLYGGVFGTPAEMQYFDYFKNRYQGVAEWHEKLQHEALKTGMITLPTGRQYAFPRVQRMPNGGVTQSTQIKNFPVQGFATADLMLVVCVAVYHMMRIHGVKSLFINQVHDSIVFDIFPGEEEIMLKIVGACMLGVRELLRERYGIDYNYPVTADAKLGPTWMRGTEKQLTNDLPLSIKSRFPSAKRDPFEDEIPF